MCGAAHKRSGNLKPKGGPHRFNNITAILKPVWSCVTSFLLENKPVVNKYDIMLSSQTSATDVLKAMGAMPSGFRSTTLGKMAKEGKLLWISAWIWKYNFRYWITDILSHVCCSGSFMIYKINDGGVKQVFRERELSERGTILSGWGCRRIYHGEFSFPYF